MKENKVLLGVATGVAGVGLAVGATGGFKDVPNAFNSAVGVVRDVAQLGLAKAPELVMSGSWSNPLAPKEAEAAKSLEVPAVFSNVSESQTDIEAKPVFIHATFLEKDANGNVQNMYAIARFQNTVDEPGKRILYKSAFNVTTGAFDKPVGLKALDFYAQSVVASGDSILVGGSIDPYNQSPRVDRSTDGGKSYKKLTLTGNNALGTVFEMLPIDGTDCVALNIFSFDTYGSMGIFNPTTGQVMETTGSNFRFNLKQKSLSADKKTATFLANYSSDGSKAGIVEKQVNLETGASTQTSPKYTENGNIAGFAITKDTNGAVTRVMSTNESADVFYMADSTSGTEVKSSVFYGNWLDAKGISGYLSGTLDLSQLTVVGDTVYAGGFYVSTVGTSNRAVVLSWPVSTPTSLIKNVLRYKTFSEKDSLVIGSMQAIVRDGKKYLEAPVYNVGYVAMELNADGSMPDVPVLSYPDSGLGDPAQAVSFRTEIPVAFKNYRQ